MVSPEGDVSHHHRCEEVHEVHCRRLLRAVNHRTRGPLVIQPPIVQVETALPHLLVHISLAHCKVWKRCELEPRRGPHAARAIAVRILGIRAAPPIRVLRRHEKERAPSAGPRNLHKLRPAVHAERKSLGIRYPVARTGALRRAIELLKGLVALTAELRGAG